MTEPGARYIRFINRNGAFWSATQQIAFELACDLAGVPVTLAGAKSWMRQRGAAFQAWREISHTQRKRLIAEEIGS